MKNDGPFGPGDPGVFDFNEGTFTYQWDTTVRDVIDRILRAQLELEESIARQGLIALGWAPPERPSGSQALRGAADAVPVDLWCTHGRAERRVVEGFQEWLRERANRLEEGLG